LAERPLPVVFTPLAERQIGRLYDYITGQAGERTAERYVTRIINFCNRLETFPVRGRARDDILAGLRTIGFERRITIAFMVLDDSVLIEGVFYAGQDFENALRR